ncbi:MAG: M48 family metalloprotease [Chitinophagales bacterium]
MNNLIHPKENTYKTIMFIVGGIIWLVISCLILAFIVTTLGVGLIFGILYICIIAFFSWIASQFFKAQILGDSVKVSNSQYPEIHEKVVDYCQKVNLAKIPEVFVFNSNGMLNAFAVKFFMKKYVMLTSSIVDIAYKDNNHYDELNFIIGHELGHHAANHTSFKRNLLIGPAKIIPFIGAAYSRACELTADRHGMYLSNNANASINSLINLAHGSKALSPKTNIDSFASQENEIPEFIGFLIKIYSTHPRLTKRVIELKSFSTELNINTENYTSNIINNNYSSKKVSIGRASDCTIVINDTTVSKMHAEIIFENGNISIRDLGSTNGTFINGNKLNGTQLLHPNDIVKAGNSVVTWQNYI